MAPATAQPRQIQAPLHPPVTTRAASGQTLPLTRSRRERAQRAQMMHGHDRRIATQPSSIIDETSDRHPMPTSMHPHSFMQRSIPCTFLLLVTSLFALLHGGNAMSSELIEECRSARKDGVARAHAICQNAADKLMATDRNDDAFEALMHSAELATRQSEVAQAQAALESAATLVHKVSDPLATQRLERRRGLLAYHRGQPVQALSNFLKALAAATASQEDHAIAVSHNDLGVIYQQLGDLPSALNHLQLSLERKRDLAEPRMAPTLSNIGSLYRQLGDHPQSERFLQRALRAQEDAGQTIPAARTREELGTLRHAQGRLDDARTELDTVWHQYAGPALARERMRLALQRADLEAEQSQRQAAQRWLDTARREAAAIGRTTLLSADLIQARLAQTPDERRQAIAQLSDALQRSESAAPLLATEGYLVLSQLHEADGDASAALTALHAHLTREKQQAELRHNERFDALRVTFDLANLEAERDRLELEHTRQQNEIAQARSQRLGIAIGALLVLAVLVVFFQRRLYRQHWQAENDRIRLNQRIEQARAAASALRTDIQSMAWLLDQHATPALVFDASGRIRAITPSAAARLQVEPSEADAKPLTSVIGQALAEWAQAQIEHASLTDTEQPSDKFVLADGSLVQCRRIEREEELGVLYWEQDVRTTSPATPEDAASPVEAEAAINPISTPEFRTALVKLMQDSLDLWERITLKNRIELAERSGVWRITIDDGRLRARTLDRYLSLETLPERPRWREVLRTGYFVLAELPLDTEQRDRLESNIAFLQQAAGLRAAA